jgi:alpha-ketoglutarate-dependent taurine dioxygenase
MEKVRKVVWSNIVVYRWKKGDIVMLDNHRVSHGRLPFYCPRKIIVSWGESY